MEVLRIAGFPEHSVLVESRIAGYMERTVEISGGRDVSMNVTASMSRGDPYAEFAIGWKI